MYLVALSGGADSVCLLRSLIALGYHVEAVHCNFHLRGEESDSDEQFCKNLCHSLDLPLHLVHFDTREYAQLHRISIEMAARELRYSYFEQLRNDIHAAGICVGHHQDDSVETFLLNLIRSTGVQGLTGISPQNGNVFRPLLCVNRYDIIEYLKSIQQDYITDSTNLVADVQRNKIRLEVIPLLKSINPAVCENIWKTADRLAEVSNIVDIYMEKEAKWTITEHGYLSFPIKNISHEYLLWYLLKDYQFTSGQIEQIFENRYAESGRIWQSPTHELLIDRGQILLASSDSFIDKKIVIPESGTYVYDSRLKLKLSLEDISDNLFIDKDKRFSYLDVSSISFPLCLRPVQLGDKFIPFGMKGAKLLSDFMTDTKLSLFEKRQQLVLTDSDDNILWVVNQRPDNRYCITESTTTILKIEAL